MERHARLVSILLDGRRTIQDIAHLIHRSEAEVEHVLVDLTQRGYTTYVSG
jgi:predicted transcriptional regulator